MSRAEAEQAEHVDVLCSSVDDRVIALAGDELWVGGTFLGTGTSISVARKTLGKPHSEPPFLRDGEQVGLALVYEGLFLQFEAPEDSRGDRDSDILTVVMLHDPSRMDELSEAQGFRDRYMRRFASPPRLDVFGDGEFPVVEVDDDLLTPPWPSGKYTVLLPGATITLRLTPRVEAALDHRRGFFVSAGHSVGCIGNLVRTFTRNDIPSVGFAGVTRAELEPGRPSSGPAGWARVRSIVGPESGPEEVIHEATRLRRLINQFLRRCRSGYLRRVWREISRIEDPDRTALEVTDLAGDRNLDRQRFLEAFSLVDRLRVSSEVMAAHNDFRRRHDRDMPEPPPAEHQVSLADAYSGSDAFAALNTPRLRAEGPSPIRFIQVP